jgi:hypothetical protein
MYSCTGCEKKMRAPEKTITITGKGGVVLDRVFTCFECHDKILVTMDDLRREASVTRGKQIVKGIKKGREKEARKKKEREEG